MHLMYTLDANGNRLYTLKKVAQGQVTKSAHPARFSPDDKWSRQRVTLKRRFGLLLTQQSEFFFRECDEVGIEVLIGSQRRNRVRTMDKGDGYAEREVDWAFV